MPGDPLMVHAAPVRTRQPSPRPGTRQPSPRPAPKRTEAEKATAKSLGSSRVTKAAETLGSFYAFCLDTGKALFKRPVQWREFLDQVWFITSVSLVPTILVAVPFCVIISFQANKLLIEIGAIDLAGAGAGLAIIREIGPIVSVLVVAGAGATAVCADIGSRKIREELDAMTVLGINPVHRLVVPRVAAAAVVSVFLSGFVCATGLVGSYVFSVYVQGATSGLFVSSLTLLVGLTDLIASLVKAFIFGLLAGLVACYLGMNAQGGPKGVGDAVNQTVVFAFLLLFFANSIITTIVLQIQN